MSRSVLILFNAFLVLSGLLFMTLTIEYPDDPPSKYLVKPEDKIIPYHRKSKVGPAYTPYKESMPKRNPHGKMA